MATPPDFSVGAVLTAAQMNAVGMWKITPTSVSGSGTVLSGANIELTSATAPIINGVFTSDYDFYRIYMYLQGSASQVAITGQLTIAGVATAANYTTQRLNAFSTTVSASLVSAAASFDFGNTTTSIRAPVVADVFFPNNNTTTHLIIGNHNYQAFPDMLSFIGTRHTVATQFDGFQLGVSGGNLTGRISVFGLNNV
jgi:hypothetical protein